MAVDVTWRYQLDNQELGPVSTDDLCGMFQRGELTLDTPVWCAAVNRWVAARTIPGFRQAVVSAAATIPGNPTPVQSLDVPIAQLDYAPSMRHDGYEPHPWLRFFARGIDTTLFTVTLVIGCLIAFGGHSPIPSIVFYILPGVLLAFLEAALLCAFGTTPGKRLLGITIETETGERPSYGQALSRSFLVWIVGQAIGIPVASFVAHIIGYNQLTSEGETTWDRTTHLRVRHAPCGVWRVVGIWFLTWVYAVAMIIGGGMLMVLTNLRTPRAFAVTPASRPLSSYTAGHGLGTRVVIDPPQFDPRTDDFAGRWVIVASRKADHGTIKWTSTLTLNRDGTYSQSIRGETDGKPRPDLSQDWSGTWSLNGSRFIETVVHSTSSLHPPGTWQYTLQGYSPTELQMQRQLAPAGAPGAGVHTLYRYHRQSSLAAVGE